jgi:DNA-3-methyladenine glycosylase I
VRYHDDEWGVPVHDDRLFFEMLLLEGAQAGLSWETVLRRRESYRIAFDGFDIHRVAGYGEADAARLLGDPGIIRNRAKVAAAIGNARAFLAVQSEFGSFDAYAWRFVGGEPLRRSLEDEASRPVQTPESVALSKDLLGRGFRFAGPTICYAFMQACGLVNDHLITCFRFAEIGATG